jgi:hypothetical protein
MLTIDPDTFEIKKVWIIDFGRSSIIPAGKTEQNVYKKFKFQYDPNHPGLRKTPTRGRIVRRNTFMREGLSQGDLFSGENRRVPNTRLNTLSSNELKELVRKHSKRPRSAALNIGGNIFGPPSPTKRPQTARGSLFGFLKK